MKKTSLTSGKLLAPIAVLFCIVAVIVFTIACNNSDNETDTGVMPSLSDSAADTSSVPATSGYDTSSSETGQTSKNFFSPVSVDTDKDGNVYTADLTDRSITKYSPDNKLITSVKISRAPRKVLADGESLYVLSGESDGILTVFDLSLTKSREIKVGHTPSDIAVIGKTAYVVNRFSSDISIVDIDKGTVRNVQTGREPTCLAVSGELLYIGCFLPEENSLEEHISSDVVVFSTKTDKVSCIVDLVNGSKCISGISASEDGKSVYVTHLVGRYTYPTTQLDRSWVNSNAFSVIDTKDNTATAFLLDDLEKGAGNPYDVELSKDGKTVYFSTSGTNEIIKIDTVEMNKLVDSVKNGTHPYVSSVASIVDYIPFLHTAKTRVKTGGKGLRDISLSGDNLFVCEYYTGDVLVLDSVDLTVKGVLSAGNQPEFDSVRMGEFLWNDAESTYQGWQSCASCHPDGRSDGLNWDEGGDGLGTPKNTPSLLYSFRTPPSMKTGLCENAELMIDESVIGAKYAVFTEEQLSAMYDYIRSLAPADSPYLVNGKYSDKALEGKTLFEEVGCSKCHPSPLYTDLSKHRSPYLGADGSSENRDFDTPTLVEVWRSFPYDYVGSELSVESIIRKFSSKELTDKEVAAIKEFVLSIGVVDEAFGVEEIISSLKGNLVYTTIVPSMTVERFTVRRQSDFKDRANITFSLYDNVGKSLFSKSLVISSESSEDICSFDVGMTLPADFAKGGYILITIKDDKGNAIASDYKLVYNG